MTCPVAVSYTHLSEPEKCADEAEKIIALEKISAEGLYTHFAVADCPDDEESVEYTKNQSDFILNVYDILCNRGIKLEHLHFLNSAGACYHNNPCLLYTSRCV